jgi:hypothetical protein
VDRIDYVYGPIIPSDLPFSIGAGYKYNENWGWDYFFHGSIDEVAVFAVPLDYHEIMDLYQGRLLD